MVYGPFEPEMKWDDPAFKTALLSKTVRENFGWLARTFITTDPNLPANPREGMPRVLGDDENNVKLQYYIQGTWRTVLQHLELGVPAPQKQVIQITPAATVWTIDHNLGGPVLCMAFDTSWREIQAADIQQVGVPINRVIVTHAAPEDGWLVIIG